MKKLITLLLALLLLFSLTAVCFADAGHEDGDSPVGQTHEDPENPGDHSLVSPETGASWLLAGTALLLGLTGLAVSGKKLIR